jgi:hypothetical protein
MGSSTSMFRLQIARRYGEASNIVHFYGIAFLVKTETTANAREEARTANLGL